MSISANAHRMIEARRKQDSNYREMDRIRQQNERTLQIANFEIVTAGKIDRRIKKATIDSMVKRNEVALLERRRRLAELLNDEMQQWQAETLAKVETQEDRKARIMERAYELRDKRNRAREEYIQECYNRQWRDACDDARLLDSQALTKHMSDQRLAQIEEKRRLKQTLSAEENAFVEEWKKQLAKLESSSKEKEAKRDLAAKQMQEGIREQMAYNSQSRREHFQRTREEDEQELERLRDAIAQEEELQRRRREEELDRGRAVREFNNEYKHLTKEKAALQREQDTILLEYALRKEREANEAEEAKRLANKNAAIRYRKYLEEQMVKEAEDTAFMDEVCKREEEKVWKARDDVLQARQDARDRLMELVDQGRQEQIKAKAEAMAREREEGKIFAQRFLEEAKVGVERERAAAAARRQLNMENSQILSQQLATRRHNEELTKQEQYLEDKKMKYMERLHTQKLQEQGGTLRTNFPLKSGQWYS